MSIVITGFPDAQRLDNVFSAGGSDGHTKTGRRFIGPTNVGLAHRRRVTPTFGGRTTLELSLDAELQGRGSPIQ